MTDPKPAAIPYFSEDGSSVLPPVEASVAADPIPLPSAPVEQTPAEPEAPTEAPEPSPTADPEPTPPSDPAEPGTAPASGPRNVDYKPNQQALKASKGDPAVWARELGAMLAAVTGIEFDATTFEPWFASYSRQLVLLNARSIAFEIANLPIDAEATGDIAFELLDFRDEMARLIRRRAS